MDAPGLQIQPSTMEHYGHPVIRPIAEPARQSLHPLYLIVQPLYNGIGHLQLQIGYDIRNARNSCFQ